jgi:hypothetical protein
MDERPTTADERRRVYRHFTGTMLLSIILIVAGLLGATRAPWLIITCGALGAPLSIYALVRGRQKFRDRQSNLDPSRD